MSSETRAITAKLDEVEGKLVGYAAVWDTATTITQRGKQFSEIIKKGAFKRAISENQDVILNVDHDDSKLLARTKSGTLKLAEDTHGLRVEAALPSSATMVKEQIQRGDYDGMSFRFNTVDDYWHKDGTREIRDVDLLDVAIVARPAYDCTSLTLRSKTNWKLENNLLRKLLPSE